MKIRIVFPAILMLLPVMGRADVVDGLLDSYRQAGASEFSPMQGQARWQQAVIQGGGGKQKSCQTCHGKDLTQVGKHAKTGKKIEPMAPSVNPKRLSDSAKIEKWFKRNCKWTLGRECTPQEKGDFLVYLRQQ